MRSFMALALVVALAMAVPAPATLVSIGGYMPWPAPVPFSMGTGNLWNTYLSLTMAAATDKVAVIFQVPETCTTSLTDVWFRTDAVTTSNSLTISVQTVSAVTGDATGTNYGGSTSVAQATVVAATGYPVTLGTQATPTPGDLAAIVIEFTAWTTGNLTIATEDNVVWQSGETTYLERYNAGAWTRFARYAVAAIKCNGAWVYVPGLLPSAAKNDESVAANTTPDEVGNVYSISFSGRAAWAGWYGDLNADVEIRLYGTDGTTVLAKCTLDSNQQAFSLKGERQCRLDTPSVLSVNSNYRVVVKPLDNTASFVASTDIDGGVGATMMAAMPGGTAIQYTSRTDAGSWSQNANRRAMVWLYFDQLDDGAGAAARIIPSTVVKY